MRRSDGRKMHPRAPVRGRMAPIRGIHHVTAIAGDPQENLDFYTGTLGMRLVKRSVNQDDPGTYHLFYADAEGRPGSDLTFFPWPNMGAGRTGTGQVNEVVFAVPPASVDAWGARLQAEDVAYRESVRFGERTLAFHDPHGLRLAVSGTALAEDRPFTAWKRSAVPATHQLRGIHAVRVAEVTSEATASLATRPLGMTRVAEDDGFSRYQGADAWSGFLDVADKPSLPRGAMGVGTVHHVAWRVGDDAHQLATQVAVRAAGTSTTPVIDRFWFRSVYFREPGGVLFELATDGPGFGVDEPMEALGDTLVLPPWLEPRRAEIEAALPPLSLPAAREARP